MIRSSILIVFLFLNNSAVAQRIRTVTNAQFGNGNKFYSHTTVINNANFAEYRQLLILLNEWEDHYSDISESNIIKRNKYRSKIDSIKQEIENYQSSIIKVAETFSKSKTQSYQIKRAQKLFANGDLNGALLLLESQASALSTDTKNLQIRKTQIDSQLKEKAEQFMLIAGLYRLSNSVRGKNDSIIKYYKLSIDSYPCWDNILELSNFYLHINRESDAIKCYQNFLMNRCEKDIERVDVLHQIANILSNQVKWEDARSYYFEAFAVSNRIKSKDSVAKAIIASLEMDIGLFYNRKENPDSALFWFKKVLDLNTFGESDVNPISRITLYNNIGDSYSYLGQKDSALYFYEQGRKISENKIKLGDTLYIPVYATTLNEIGRLYYEKRIFDSSLMNYSKAINIRRKEVVDNPGFYYPKLAITLYNTGVVLYQMGFFDSSLKFHLEALSIRVNLDSTYLRTVAESLNAIGKVWYSKGQLDTAFSYYSKALEIERILTKEIGEPYFPTIADLCHEISLVYTENNIFEYALEMEESALNLYQYLYSKNQYIYAHRTFSTLLSVAQLYLKVGRKSSCKQAVSQAEHIYSERKDQNDFSELYIHLLYLKKLSE